MGRNLRSVFTRCDAPLPLGRKYVAIKLLTNQTLYFAVELKCTVQEIFDQLCFYLGIADSQLFGLARQSADTNEFCFVDQGSRLDKLAPKSWKTQTSAGLDGNGRPLIVLYLRVQYFVDCMIFWQDRVACHHYYNQIKANLLSYDWAISQEKAFMLASLALQADLGNYDPVKHRGSYFDPVRYFPQSIIKTVGEGFIVVNLPLMHRDHHNLNRTSAQLAFINESQEFAMHVYKVQQKKSNYDFTYLGISLSGVQIYQPIAAPVLADSSCNIVITKQCLFPWSDIFKLKFDKRRFEVRLEGRCRQLLEFVYVCSSENTASSLLELCKRTHQFNLAIQPRLTELRQTEKRNRVPKYRESYIYDPEEASCGQRTPTKSRLNKSIQSRNSSPSALSGSDPRISVISTSSSNTTSGVMSDKAQSPESEDEDPRVPTGGLSLESLSTSHLNKESGGCSDYGTLENLNKKALSEHNLSYHNKLHSKDMSGHVQSYMMNGYSNCLSSADAVSHLTAVPEATSLDKATSLDNIALANACLYHSKPQTDLRIAVSYVDAMRATSEEYLCGDSRPQKATPLYQKNKVQLKAAPQPATRSTSFAGHQKPRPPPIKPRTKIGVSSLNKCLDSNIAAEIELHPLSKSRPELVSRPAGSSSNDSLSSCDVLTEVRLKSSQHNLPFMSALCQDRSLMPKTVPTMRPNSTTQLNDSRRFSYCSYLVAGSPQSPPVSSGNLFKYTSLGNMAPSSHLSAPARQMIPHKLSQETGSCSQRKAAVF